MPRLPLRLRVGLAYALMGLLLSATFAAASALIAENYEHILVEALLQGQSRHYLAQAADGEVLPVAPGFAVYRQAEAPAELRDLGADIREIHRQGKGGIHVGTYGPPGQRIVMTMDVGEIEKLERYMARLMVVIIVLGTVISGWLGWLLAGRTVRPVRQLARDVGSLPLDPVPTQLARAFSKDELGQLAGAIDAYQQRLFDADVAEKMFFANASHELRTPITVVQGAIEVMRDDPALVAGQAARLDRLNRGVGELAALLEALLLSGRGLPKERVRAGLRAAFDDAIGRLSRTNPASVEDFRLEDGQEVYVLVPMRWLDCLLLVLLQRLQSKAPGSRWNVRVTADGIALLDPGVPSGVVQVIERSDLGLSLMFVDRLAHGLGWRLRQGRDGQERLSVELLVPTQTA